MHPDEAATSTGQAASHDPAASSGKTLQEPRVIATLHRLQERVVLGTAAVYSAGYAAIGLGLLAMSVGAEGLALRRVPWRRGPLDVYLLAFALVMGVSGLLSPHRGVATGSAVLMALTMYIAFGVPFRILTRDGRFLSVLIRAWYAGGVGAAALALVTYAASGAPQAAVPVLGPNALASTLAVALMLGVGLVWSTASRARYAILAGTVLIALALALTLSRGAWIGAATGLVVFAIAAWRGRTRAARDPRPRRRVWALLGLAAVLVVALAFIGGDTAKLRKKVLTIPDLFRNRERISLARSALAIAADHPLVGSGLNTFVLLHPHPSVAAEIPAHKRRARTQSFAHNIFLNMAAEGGILGLVAFTALLARGTAAGWRWVKAAGTDRISSTAVFAAFIALLVHQQFDGTVLSVHLSVGLWFLLAIMTASEPPRRP